MSARMAPEPGQQRRLFNREEYYRLSYEGYFNDERVELIGGEIVTMAAQGNPHGLSISLTDDALQAAFGAGFWVRNQLTLDLSPHSVPDPDLAVVPGSKASYRGQKANPTSAVLIVEVSETTLAEDRTRKASLYAAAGIADYWIVNLQNDCLEVRRDPVPDATAEFGHSYSSLATLQAGESASPLAAPAGTVAVADLLPG